MAPFLVRAALPSAVLLGATALANWHDTYTSVTSQPYSPVINHPTAWTSLAPAMSNHNVAAGPFRLATIVLACLCALAVRRAWQAKMPGDGAAWTRTLLAEVLWWAALTLALRSFFEPVMVSYYPWPPMAVALIPAATLGWPRLFASGLVAGGLTAAAQGPSHAVWIWWVPIVAGLVVQLALSYPSRIGEPVTLLTPAEVATGQQASLPGARASRRPATGLAGSPYRTPGSPYRTPGGAYRTPGGTCRAPGGGTGSRNGRLADTPSPEDVPRRRRLTQGPR
jgi:hypothetical protein